MNGFLEWKQSRKGLLVSGIIELVLAYIFGSWAIDTGSWWLYLLGLVFSVGAFQSLVQAVFYNGKD